jgi:hypothetical protein
MKQAELNFLAETMGWHLKILPNGDQIYLDEGDHVAMFKNEWQPDKRIAQAFMLLEEFDDWIIFKDPGGNDYGVRLRIQELKGFSFDCGTVQEAICKAVLNARGYKDDT